MAKLENHIVPTWYIAKTEDNSVVHYGLCDVGSVTTTGQPIFTTYEVEQDWLDALLLIGITIEEE